MRHLDAFEVLVWEYDLVARPGVLGLELTLYTDLI